MAHGFSGTTTNNKPIEDVFAFLADGTNDRKFSPRVQEITKTTDGPPGVGTVYASTVKDAGMTTKREFELTAFDAPSRIRWRERSKNMVTVREGGYDLAPEADGTRVTIHQVLEGHGVGKLIAPLARRAGRRAPRPSRPAASRPPRDRPPPPPGRQHAGRGAARRAPPPPPPPPAPPGAKRGGGGGGVGRCPPSRKSTRLTPSPPS